MLTHDGLVSGAAASLQPTCIAALPAYPPAVNEILLVGRRQAATDAGRDLGYSVSVQEVASREEQATGAFGGMVDDAVASAKKRYKNKPPKAVVAVAEGAVPAAAAIREKFGLQGLGREAAANCHDKLLMKKAIVAAGIPCADWLETTIDTRPEEVVERLGLPVVLKLPVSSGGRGVAICTDLQQVAYYLHPGMLAEAFTEGTEMSVETFRRDHQTLFRNCTRYLIPHWASIVPADLSADDGEAIDALAEQVHDALGIDQGMTHMEIFLTPGGPVFGEIAARPPGGRLMELISRAHGFDAWQAVLKIALDEEPDFPVVGVAKYAGAWLLYPDQAGTVTKISGPGEARKLPHVARLNCRAKPNRHYPERSGTGQSAGEIIAVADSMQECERSLYEAREMIRFEVKVDSDGGDAPDSDDAPH